MYISCKFLVDKDHIWPQGHGRKSFTVSRTDTFYAGIWPPTNHNIWRFAYFHTATGERVSTLHWRVSGTSWRPKAMFCSAANIFTHHEINWLGAYNGKHIGNGKLWWKGDYVMTMWWRAMTQIHWLGWLSHILSSLLRIVSHSDTLHVWESPAEA